MMTLSVHVSETITVIDHLFHFVKQVMDSIFAFFSESTPSTDDEVATDTDVGSNDEGRAPPTLGVTVSDGIGTNERLGG